MKPKKNGNRHKGVFVGLHMPAELRARIGKIAERHGRSASSEIRIAVEERADRIEKMKTTAS